MGFQLGYHWPNVRIFTLAFHCGSILSQCLKIADVDPMLTQHRMFCWPNISLMKKNILQTDLCKNIDMEPCIIHGYLYSIKVIYSGIP
jgi:hypothetical protein